MNPKFYNRFKGFSVAEAMVTLLIVSIALSAIAPIFSKRNAATLNTQSKWEKTTNGNIVRSTGRIGLGYSNTEEPPAKLAISHTPDNNTNNFSFFRIAQGGISLLEVTAERLLALNTLDANTAQVLSIRQNGVERLKFGSDGTVTWKDSSGSETAVINSDGSVDTLNVKKGDKTTTINADGSVSFGSGASIADDGSASFGVPAGAIMLFATCPTANWTDLGALSCTCSGTGCTGCTVNFGGADASSFHACQRNAYGSSTPAGG